MTRDGSSRFVSNTAALAVSTAITALLTLAQVKLLSSFLPRETFGLFASLRGLSLLIAMLAANGLPQLLVRYLPQHEANGHRSRALALSAWCIGGVVVALVVLCAATSTWSETVFSRVPGAERSPALFFWFYATTAGVALKLVLYGGFNGLRRLGVQMILETVSLAAQVTWIFLRRDSMDIVLLFKILGTVSVATVILGLPWYVGRVIRDVGGDAGAAQRGGMSGYGSYWAGATGLSLVALTFTDVDRYVLSQVLALEVLSLFHIGARVVRLVNRFLAVPVLAFQPEVTRVHAQGRGDVVGVSTRVFQKVNLLTSVFAAVAVIVYARETVLLISSDLYLGARPLLAVMAISLPLTAMTAPLTAVMKSLDRVRSALLCDLVYAVTYVVLLLALGSALGLVGAGLAHLCACGLQLIAAIRWSPPGVLANAWYKQMSLVVLFAVASLAPVYAVGLLGTSAAVVFVKTVLLVPALGVYRLLMVRARVFDDEEKERLRGMLSSRRLGLVAGWFGA